MQGAHTRYSQRHVAFKKHGNAMIYNMIRLVIMLSLIGFGCSGKVDKSNKGQFEINQTLKSGKRFYVQDSSQYSSDFIDELRALDSQYDSVRLIGKDLIINKSDTSVIPTELPINVNVNYQVIKGDTTYRLGLKRINYTNIDYEFRVNDKLIKTGQIILPAGFIFGSEFTKTDSENAIPLTQYFDKKGIWTCIKIEIGNANRIDFYMQSDNDSTKNFKNVPILTKK
jgi:hypothetical protein